MRASLPCFAAGPIAVCRFVRAGSLAFLILCAATDGLAKEQRAVFGRTIASESVGKGGALWSIRVQGRLFEPAEGSRKRQHAIDALAPIVNASRSDPLYRERAGYFVSDSVRNARVSIAIGKRVVALGPTDASGCFASDVTLRTDEAARLTRDGFIAFASRPARRRSDRFPGTAVYLKQEGVTVVTDVDDTIKETNIRSRADAKANTFVRPFRPVPGMAGLYQAWQDAGGAKVHFHVVSAGPWHLYEPLRQFTKEAGFPAFTWDMRCVDVTNPVVLIEETLNLDPERLSRFKIATIRALMLRLPKRHVVLVGDSGERDPEAYSAIVQEFGDRVDAVYIRNVSGEGSGDVRYDKLFRPLNALSKLQVFEQPSDLPRHLSVAR